MNLSCRITKIHIQNISSELQMICHHYFLGGVTCYNSICFNCGRVAVHVLFIHYASSCKKLVFQYLIMLSFSLREEGPNHFELVKGYISSWNKAASDYHSDGC